MRLGKRAAIWQGRQVHGSLKLFGECDAGVPPATAVDLLAVYQYRVLALANSLSEHREAIGVGRIVSTDGAHVLVPERWLIPIIERNAHIDGTRRRLYCYRIRSHDRAGHILC